MSDDRRARSAAQADLAMSHRLTLVVAAPGWGKSTLLRRLGEQAPSVEVSRPPSGWTPFAVARGMLDGLRSLGLEPADDVLPPHPAPDSPDHPDHTTALAAAVCTAVARIETPALVLLDDVETSAGDPLEQFLEALVLHLPSTLHLVVACRRAPAMRLARLRAAGEIARISARDLALTPDEVHELDLDPSGEEMVGEIVRVSGGWPLAVRLAAAAVRRSGPVHHDELLERVLAPGAVLVDYLAEEVLAELTDGERRLLALAAHLPYLSDELLVDLGHDDLVGDAEALVDLGLFLEPLPGRRVTASLLGGAFLRRALPRPDDDELRRAVEAFEARGDVEAALVLAADAGDPQLAAAVVERVVRPDRVLAALARALDVAERAGEQPVLAERRGDLAYLRGDWDAALASYQRAVELGDPGSPRLARKRGVILYLRGRLDEGEAACQAARVDGTDPAQEAQVLAWHAAMRWVRGDVDGCQALLDPAREAAERSGDDVALATVHTTLAMLAALRGDRRGNAQSYRLALAHAQRAGDVVQVVRILTNRGSHFAEEGSYPEALVELTRAIEAAELIGSETFCGLAYFNRGDTYLRMGRLDDARRDLRRAQDIWERVGSELVDYATGQLGDVQHLRGQRTEALAHYAQAIAWAERRGDLQGLVPSLIGTARVLTADDPDRARAFAERAIEANQAVSQPHALLAGGWVELRSGDRVAATARAEAALKLAHAHRDRPAVAEGLLLQAAIQQPPSVELAEEAGRLWHELGNPIGEARAALQLAETSSGPARTELLARAEALLLDTGAWGYLADVRRAMTAGATGPSPIAISTLGGFRVTRNGAPIEISEWGSRKARDFVKLLVARRGAPVVRDEVASLLWADESDRSARRLSVLLSTIRGVLDPQKSFPPDRYVAADHDTVWLVREQVDVDVEQFFREAADGRRLLADGDTEKGTVRLARAAARYLGDFCADDPYADWAAGTRELARHTFVETANQLGRLADEAGDHGEAIRLRLRILDVDPYDETAHLDLVRALSAQRRHGEARRAYRTYCQRLAELDLDPAPFPEQERDLNTA